jgi:hypothetical protein
MSSKTITQAIGGPSVALPPAPIYPATQQLTKKLLEYDQAVVDVAEARGHLARAESDEALAADSRESDSEDRLAVAQNLSGSIGPGLPQGKRPSCGWGMN